MTVAKKAPSADRMTSSSIVDKYSETEKFTQKQKQKKQ